MIKDNVRAIRLAKGIKGSHIAKALGLTRSGYSWIEIGPNALDVERLKVIAGVLGEDVAIFFDDKCTKSVLKRIKKEAGKIGRSKGA